MKLLDSWYAVALASALRPAQPLAVQLHGERFALWRDAAGGVAAVLDRCPHKGASLSAGRVSQGALACGYHGWCFGSDGHCSAIPAQHTGEPMPRRAHTRAVPCREAAGFLWLWWARDPQAPLPDPAALPPPPPVGPLPEAGDGKWRHLEGEVEWQANWLRVLEAFMDLTHAPFVHSGSFGAMAPDQLMPEEQWVKDDSLYERVLAPRDRHYRADQGRGLRGLFNADEQAGDQASDGGVQHIQLWLANVSLVRVVFGDFQISLCTAHVPLDEGRTLNLWRHFRSFLRTPLADGNARGRVDRFMAEDQRMVETLTPRLPDLDGRGDLLLASDAMTIGLRKLLREKRSAGLLV
ncbi:MAG: aromatic ring-hydroxylating dioxygenase subunit alpha [Synechococcaceae bacterium WB8_1B_136]|nr:aromatic ring-hydroxylating dioxygenase subunit alpha [Synechococcaceae bacterium WB8_1B_136]